MGLFKRHRWNKLASGKQICADCGLMRDRSKAPTDRWTYWWERSGIYVNSNDGTKTFCAGKPGKSAELLR